MKRYMANCLFMAFVAGLVLPAMAAEQEVLFRGQKIKYEGAELKWIGEPTAPDAELLFIYKNTSGVNSFTPSVAAEARVLAVVGGGAGGTVRSSAPSWLSSRFLPRGESSLPRYIRLSHQALCAGLCFRPASSPFSCGACHPVRSLFSSP